jgi:hypothetical protein
MAKIVLGMGTSHAPQLSMPPSDWWRRVDADKANPELWYRGQTFTFPDLVKERASQHLEDQLSPEQAEARYQACQRDIATLSATLDRVHPDVAIIFGDDQHEAFLDDNMPAISVYWGETINNVPHRPSPRTEALGIAASAWGAQPPAALTHPVESKLGLHLIESLIREDFDVAHSRSLREDRHGGGVGHAFGFVYRRLMNDEVIPQVPVLLNTYYPPNQPSLKRCYELGRAVRRAVEAWDSDQTVALIASGGLSHFVIEEDLDREIIAGLTEKDATKLTRHDVLRFNSGTSEIRNWIVVAGALEESDLRFNLVDYQPCYRSEAGTGCAMAFGAWE